MTVLFKIETGVVTIDKNAKNYGKSVQIAVFGNFDGGTLDLSCDQNGIGAVIVDDYSRKTNNISVSNFRGTCNYSFSFSGGGGAETITVDVD